MVVMATNWIGWGLFMDYNDSAEAKPEHEPTVWLLLHGFKLRGGAYFSAQQPEIANVQRKHFIGNYYGDEEFAYMLPRWTRIPGKSPF